MDILQTLAASTAQRYQGKKTVNIETRAYSCVLDGHPFKHALKSDHLAVIAEVKKASPSKGVIASSFDPLAIAKEYEAGGASALSVLTEPTRFLGDDAYLTSIGESVSLPLLRKDFIITAYQILESRILGASAILLIAALLDHNTLSSFLSLAKSLGMDALVEVHDKVELDLALGAGATIIGVNNRNLRNFSVDLETSLRLIHSIPSSVTAVSESGIRGREDAILLKQAGFSAILVGEQLMRRVDRAQAVQELKV
ncbi:MAG: indole-3-glycerol phosphate synthase TrpC [Sphaerochaetaceae bacterium]|nr:indole-3-glycerol phosphate synthase TrpC [Sphaerochaetaceae bacterium]